MLNYHITTEAEKKLIAGWAYPRDYAIYDLPSYETQKKRGFGLTNPQNHFYSFYDGAELIGFMSLSEEASRAGSSDGVHRRRRFLSHGKRGLHMTTAKELALGGMFTALGVVLLCLGGVVPLALYACPILASAVLLPVRERCSKRVAWNCYAAIAILGTLLGPDKEASMLFVFLGYYPLIKPKFDTIRSRALRLSAKLLLAIFAVGADYLILLFVLRLDAVTQELAETAPAILWATCALGLALFLLYDLTLSRLTVLYRRRRR